MVENFKEFYNSQPKKEKSSLFKIFFPYEKKFFEKGTFFPFLIL